MASSNSSDVFHSIDEGHYNNSESLILQQCYEDNLNQPNQPVDKSLSDIRISQSQAKNSNIPNLESSLNEELEKLSDNRNHISGQRIEEIHKAIRNITEFQSSLKQKMGEATELIEIGNRKQSELYEIVNKLKDNLQSPCQIQQHGVYEDQLKRNKVLLDQSEKQLQNLVQTLKNQKIIDSNHKQDLNESRSQKTANKINPVKPFIHDVSMQKSQNKKDDRKKTYEHLEVSQNYLNNPFMIIFKKAVLENSFVVYEDEGLKILYEVSPKGLKIKLQSSDSQINLNIRGSKGRSLVLNWEQFSQAKRCFQDCMIENADSESFSVSIPLPLHLLFEKRFKFTQISSISKPKMKTLMNSYHLFLSEYDETIWKALRSSPETISFEMQKEKLCGVFSIKNNSSIHIVQIYEIEGRKLEVDIYYKSKEYLKEIVQFFKYLLCS